MSVLSFLSLITGHFENERKIRVLIGGTQPKDDGIDLGVGWDQHQPHVRRRVEAWSRALRPTADEPQINQSLNPYFREGHSRTSTRYFPLHICVLQLISKMKNEGSNDRAIVKSTRKICVKYETN